MRKLHGTAGVDGRNEPGGGGREFWRGTERCISGGGPQDSAAAPAVSSAPADAAEHLLLRRLPRRRPTPFQRGRRFCCNCAAR